MKYVLGAVNLPYFEQKLAYLELKKGLILSAEVTSHIFFSEKLHQDEKSSARHVKKDADRLKL